MTKIALTLISAVVGIALGFIGGPVQVLVLWAVAGVVIGYMSFRLRVAMLNGGVFGFIVSFMFMLHGYSGTDPVSGKLMPFAALGIFGALCGIVLGIIGSFLRKLGHNKNIPPA